MLAWGCGGNGAAEGRGRVWTSPWEPEPTWAPGAGAAPARASCPGHEKWKVIGRTVLSLHKFKRKLLKLRRRQRWLCRSVSQKRSVNTKLKPERGTGKRKGMSQSSNCGGVSIFIAKIPRLQLAPSSRTKYINFIFFLALIRKSVWQQREPVDSNLVLCRATQNSEDRFLITLCYCLCIPKYKCLLTASLKNKSVCFFSVQWLLVLRFTWSAILSLRQKKLRMRLARLI